MFENDSTVYGCTITILINTMQYIHAFLSISQQLCFLFFIDIFFKLVNIFLQGNEILIIADE